MLVVADTKESAIDRYTKDHFDDLEEDYLTPSDWKRLRTIMWFLAPFSRATLATEGRYSRIDKVLNTMDILVDCFKKALVRSYYPFVRYLIIY